MSSTTIMILWCLIMASIVETHHIHLDCKDRLDIIDQSVWPELPQVYHGQHLLLSALIGAIGYTMHGVHAVLHTRQKRTYIRGNTTKFHLYGSDMTREVIEVRGLRVIDIQIRYSFIALQTSDGIIWTAGENDRGQLGHHGTQDRPIFSPVENIPPAKQLATGNYHGVILTRHGKLMSWGWNQYQQLGRNTSSNTNPIPQTFSHGGRRGLPKFICCGWGMCTVFTESMELLTWGYNSNIGRGGSNRTPAVVEGIPATQNITKVACGYEHTVALTESGELYGWGYNGYGEQLGAPSRAVHASKLDLGDRIVRDVVVGYYITVIRTYSSVGEYFGYNSGENVRTPQLATTVEYSRDVMHGSKNGPNTWGTVHLGCPRN